MRNPITVVREKYEEHKTEIIAGTAFIAGVGVTLYCVKGYDSSQPIPGLALDEDQIKGFVVSGIATVDFLNERGLGKEFIEHREEMFSDVAKLRDRVHAEIKNI